MGDKFTEAIINSLCSADERQENLIMSIELATSVVIDRYSIDWSVYDRERRN